MRLQGKVLNWNDDKGFGFVEPNGGGERAFVHIKAFKPRARRPINGDVIIYELVRENNNRYKASNIQFAGDAKNFNKRSNKGTHKPWPHGTVMIGNISVVIAEVTSHIS